MDRECVAPKLGAWVAVPSATDIMKLPAMWPLTQGAVAPQQQNPNVRTTSGINEIQYGGSHYKGKAIQPWDYVIANNLGYLEGSIIKYVSRYQDKNGVEDLHKARHFLDKLIEVKQFEGR